MGQEKSVFQRGAEYGLWMGLYLTVMMLCAMFYDRLPVLSLVVMVMLFAGPLVLYYTQRRTFIQEQGMTQYSALWMQGIMTMIGGALISSLLMYLALKYIRPDYLYDQATQALAIYKTMPEFKDSELVKLLESMLEQNMLPTPIESVTNSFWLISFVGSITSALTALLAQRRITPRM